jgi:general secretion pathway protein E
MQPDILELYCSILEAPYGMVLASGPTGSGKTTSLYASLGHFDPKDTKIMTVEDPIEYKVPGISQIQVNRQAGMTFSTGLRGILRLDPDVILVGEVRDAETAEISVQAALTGHMVLSSIHANDAAGALLRLVDLGVEPFLVNSAVMCSIAQRLVRKPCVHCKRPVSRPEPEIRLMAKELGEERREFEYGAGCDACGHTGYLGRVPVFEMLLMTDAVRELVMKRAPASEIRLQAITEGMTSMTKDAALKVRDNLTTPSEIIRKVSTRV